MADRGPPEQEFFAVTGILTAAGELHLQPSFLSTSRGRISSGRGEMLVEGLNADGKVVLRRALDTQPLAEDGAMDSLLAVSGVVPLTDDVAQLRFLRDGVPLRDVAVPRGQPTARIEWEPPEEVVGQHRVSWSGEHPQGAPLFFVPCYSATAGESWQPLALASRETSVEVDFDRLPGGNAVIAVHVSDGFHSATVRTAGFRVPPKPPAVTILNPGDGTHVFAEEPTLLSGTVAWLEEDEPKEVAMHWTSSIDGELGEGAEVVAALTAGEHKVTFVAGVAERRRQTFVRIVAEPPQRATERTAIADSA